MGYSCVRCQGFVGLRILEIHTLVASLLEGELRTTLSARNQIVLFFDELLSKRQLTLLTND